MTTNTKLGLRRLWFQVHKWIGLLLVVLLIPLSLTGAALVWDDALDHLLHPARYAVSGKPAALPPSAYLAAAATRLPKGETPSQIRYPGGDGGPVVVTALKPATGPRMQGPPARDTIYLEPSDARVLDASVGGPDAIRIIHQLHGTFLIPGVGRSVVGWLGVAMLVSSLSGLWLWWPVSGRVTRGLRWRRQRNVDANLHHQVGFWICLPLAMLSFTGAWISFPAFFGALAGQPPRAMPRDRPVPLAATHLTADAALAAAGGGRPAAIAWPTDKAPAWQIDFGRGRVVQVDDANGAASPGQPANPMNMTGLGRTMRRWHDGTGMGFVWQLVIFLGGLAPAVLGVTGVIMWARARSWRSGVKRRTRARVAAAE